MSISRIEIYDSKNEKTVIQPPAGKEFTENWWSLGPDRPQQRAYTFETRPLPTAKEQRTEKLKKVILAASNCFTFNPTIEEIEAIFTPYLKDE